MPLFLLEVPRRVILGWSPPGICTVCGQGRRPVADREVIARRSPVAGKPYKQDADRAVNFDPKGFNSDTWRPAGHQLTTITGYACACSSTDLPGPVSSPDLSKATGGRARELPPTRPALILDPFGGTGSTALQASTLGRDAITLDMSQDYSRLARWRTTDRPEVARAMRVKKPPPPPPASQSALF